MLKSYFSSPENYTPSVSVSHSLKNDLPAFYPEITTQSGFEPANVELTDSYSSGQD